MDLEGFMLSEINQRKTNIVYPVTFGISKTKQMNKHNKTEKTLRYREQTGGCPRGRVWGYE